MAVNPYQPAPGAPPPAMVGRDAELRAIADSIARTAEGRAAQPIVFVGQRGMGKTALLHRLATDARRSAIVVQVEAARDSSLASSFRVALQDAIHRSAPLSRRMARAIEAALEELPLTYELPHEMGSIALRPIEAADLEAPLSASLRELATAARRNGRFVAILVDEIQDADFTTLRPLITAVHQSASTDQPILFACAGLPDTPRRLREARTYTERWLFFTLSLLTPPQAADAIRIPAAELGVSIDREALDLLASQSGGYPFFVQEYAKAAWDEHRRKRITLEAVQAILPGVRAVLENGFYRERLEALTPREVRFALALAALGTGAHPLRAVAGALGVSSAALGSARTQLIKKDVVVVPGPGLVEFRIPLTERYVENHRGELERRAAVGR